jgi:hypothetical protein
MFYNTKFIPIPFSLDMWKYSNKELGEKYLDKKLLDEFKVIGLTRVYSVHFEKDVTEHDCEGYFNSEDAMGSFELTHKEFFIQDPSYNTVVEFIKEHTDSDLEAACRISDIQDKMTLVLARKIND